jgi:hypothetical protein
MMLKSLHQVFPMESIMIVQSGYGTQAYSSITASSIQRQEGRAVTAAVADSAKYAEKVSLSNAGKALAASENAGTQYRTPAQEYWLGRASADPAFAKELVHMKAYANSFVMCDISDSLRDYRLPIKFSTSGRPVPDGFQARFEREAAAVDAQRRALYESEKAKGTDPLEILNKLYDFENAQSYEYQEATGSGWRGEIAAFNKSGKTNETADLQTLKSEIDARRHALTESEKAKAAERLEMLAALIEAGRRALIVPEKEEEADPLEILKEMAESADKQPQDA